MFTPVLFALAVVAGQAQPAPPPQAQPAPSPPPQGQMGPPPEFIAAAQTFGNCVKQGSMALPASVTPEAGAQQALAGCAAQRTALDARFEAWVASPGFPEAGRAQAREQYQAQMATVNTQVADGIRKARATPAPAPSPAPTPTPSK